MQFFSALMSPFTAFLSEDPNVAMTQAGLIALVVVVLFLLFYTLRDVVLRTRSFVYQCVCILLVALLPGLGFLLYLLIRPARTIKEREMEAMLQALTEGFFDLDPGLEDEADLPEIDEEVVQDPKKEERAEGPHFHRHS
jgi:hypothetical protein